MEAGSGLRCEGDSPGTWAVRDGRQSRRTHGETRSTKISTETHENFHFCENLFPRKNSSMSVHRSFIPDGSWKAPDVFPQRRGPTAGVPRA